MVRRKRRTWFWTAWRPGLAQELSLAPMFSPWLSRTAGRPVERGDVYQDAIQRLTRGAIRLAAAFDALAISGQQAADAFAAFGRAWSTPVNPS